MAPTGQCERCREWVSLDLDAELSEFEAARLRRHLRTCAACRQFDRDLRSVTAVLRGAQPVAAELLLAPVRTRRGSNVYRVAVASAAAAAAAAAMFSSGLTGDQRTAAVATVAASSNGDLISLRSLRRAELQTTPLGLREMHVRSIELD